MKIDGKCHCGAVTYEADIDPAKVLICHCTDCQTMSGTAFRTLVLSEPGRFRLLSGSLTSYVKKADSGSNRRLTFCPVCGSPIYSTAEGPGEHVFAIRLGTVRQRDKLAPSKQIWSRSRQQWLHELGTMEAVENQ